MSEAGVDLVIDDTAKETSRSNTRMLILCSTRPPTTRSETSDYDPEQSELVFRREDEFRKSSISTPNSMRTKRKLSGFRSMSGGGQAAVLAGAWDRAASVPGGGRQTMYRCRHTPSRRSPLRMW